MEPHNIKEFFSVFPLERHSNRKKPTTNYFCSWSSNFCILVPDKEVTQILLIVDRRIDIKFHFKNLFRDIIYFKTKAHQALGKIEALGNP